MRQRTPASFSGISISSPVTAKNRFCGLVLVAICSLKICVVRHQYFVNVAREVGDSHPTQTQSFRVSPEKVESAVFSK